jgi:hypothetical protein
MTLGAPGTIALSLFVASLVWSVDASLSPTSISEGDKRLQKQRVVYMNRRYGFALLLPKSWKGYRVLSSTWRATNFLNGSKASGPSLTIRHPLWTAAKPRQDIPILVITKAQWNKSRELSFGPAPIGPSEMAHNAKFVFALPARYNYAFSIGYEEVEQILGESPFRTFAPKDIPH